MEEIKSEILKRKISIADYMHLTLEVIKFRITGLVCLTTALGFLLGYEGFSSTLLYVSAGIFFLAAAAAAMNHLQERKTDGRMKRTITRPLPSGMASEGFVIFVIAAFTLAGVLVLLIKTNYAALGIGLFTYFWYNAVYTNLKKKTPLAVIPGSLVGALPPLAGWAAGRADFLEFPILYICLYFFMWQIPHFWLLLMIYDKDYKKAGFPVLTDLFSGSVLKWFTVMWLIICVLFGAGISASGLMHYTVSEIALLAGAAAVLYNVYRFHKSETGRKSIFKMFMIINFFTLLIILILTSDKLIYILK